MYNPAIIFADSSTSVFLTKMQQSCSPCKHPRYSRTATVTNMYA